MNSTNINMISIIQKHENRYCLESALNIVRQLLKVRERSKFYSVIKEHWESLSKINCVSILLDSVEHASIDSLQKMCRHSEDELLYEIGHIDYITGAPTPYSLYYQNVCILEKKIMSKEEILEYQATIYLSNLERKEF